MTLMEYINSENRSFFLPDMGTNGLFLTNYTASEVYNSPQKQLEVALKMNELFPADFIYPLSDGVIFTEVLGLELLRPDYDFPSVLEHPITDLEALSKLEIPEPTKTGRMPTNLSTFRLITQNINKPLYISIQGPFTLAVQLAGATHLLRSIIKNPEFVEKLLGFTTETVKRYAKACQANGAKYISIAEPATVTLGHERFEKLVVDNLNSIYDELTCWKGMHICGDTSEFLDLMLKCHVDALSLDQIMNYKLVMNKIPENIVLLGNLDPLDLLYYSKPSEIKDETLKLLKHMRKYSNYMCAFGCNCMNDTPIENLQTSITTGRLSHREIDNYEN